VLAIAEKVAALPVYVFRIPRTAGAIVARVTSASVRFLFDFLFHFKIVNFNYYKKEM
jgi:hypothetical protein